jgi:hypothetical protein
MHEVQGVQALVDAAGAITAQLGAAATNAALPAATGNAAASSTAPSAPVAGTYPSQYHFPLSPSCLWISCTAQLHSGALYKHDVSCS